MTPKSQRLQNKLVNSLYSIVYGHVDFFALLSLALLASCFGIRPVHWVGPVVVGHLLILDASCVQLSRLGEPMHNNWHHLSVVVIWVPRRLGVSGLPQHLAGDSFRAVHLRLNGRLRGVDHRHFLQALQLLGRKHTFRGVLLILLRVQHPAV